MKIEKVDTVGVPSRDGKRSRHSLRRDARPTARRALVERVLDRRDVLRDLVSRAVRRRIRAAEEQLGVAARRGRGGRSSRAGGEGRGIRRRDVRHRRLPHGQLRRSGWQPADPSPTVRALRRRLDAVIDARRVDYIHVPVRYGAGHRVSPPVTAVEPRDVTSGAGDEASVLTRGAEGHHRCWNPCPRLKNDSRQYAPCCRVRSVRGGDEHGGLARSRPPLSGVDHDGGAPGQVLGQIS